MAEWLNHSPLALVPRLSQIVAWDFSKTASVHPAGDGYPVSLPS